MDKISTVNTLRAMANVSFHQQMAGSAWLYLAGVSSYTTCRDFPQWRNRRRPSLSLDPGVSFWYATTLKSTNKFRIRWSEPPPGRSVFWFGTILTLYDCTHTTLHTYQHSRLSLIQPHSCLSFPSPLPILLLLVFLVLLLLFLVLLLLVLFVGLSCRASHSAPPLTCSSVLLARRHERYSR